LASVQPLEQYIGAKQQEKKRNKNETKTRQTEDLEEDLQRNARKAMESHEMQTKGRG